MLMMMMMMLCFCRFIEYGDYKDNLYGTSLESINRNLDQNKVCLVDVQPEVSIKCHAARHANMFLITVILNEQGLLQEHVQMRAPLSRLSQTFNLFTELIAFICLNDAVLARLTVIFKA